MIYSFFRVQFLQVLHYAAAMESLALSLLPVFATALDLDENFFEAFSIFFGGGRKEETAER